MKIKKVEDFIQKVNCVLILSCAFLFCNCQVGNETIVVKGTVGNHFHLSSTHTIPENDRNDLLNDLEYYFDKVDKLDKYYKYINTGNSEKAEAIVKSDSVLSKTNNFGIAYGYMMVKMHQFKILFKPLIQCNRLHESHLISITEKDLIFLENYLNKEVEIELAIERIGEIEMDKTRIYKLNRIIEN